LEPQLAHAGGGIRHNRGLLRESRLARGTLHSYRARWGYAANDPAYDTIEAKLAANQIISVPTLVIHGGGDPCNDPSTSDGKEKSFASDYQRIVLDGVGHFPQREAPEAVGKATIRFLTNRDK